MLFQHGRGHSVYHDGQGKYIPLFTYIYYILFLTTSCEDTVTDFKTTCCYNIYIRNNNIYIIHI